MTNAIARPRRRARRPLLRAVPLALALLAPGCASFVEVPVETPLQSKLDVSGFRRVLIAGFATDLLDTDVDVASETARLLQNQLIITGKLGFEIQNRSGFQAEERVVRNPTTNSPRLVRGNRYLERKGFNLNADFYFIDGKTGALLHKERFTEEVLYGEDQKVSPLSSYFELMDRLLPNFMGVISPQRIRGTRILLQ